MNETVRDLGYVGISLLKGQVCFRADDPILDAIIYNTCPTCGGTGGCPKCNGTSMGMDLEGAYIDGLCPRCEGTGLCPDCKDHTYIISAELREKALSAILDVWYETLAGPAKTQRKAVLDAVLSTVFGEIRAVNESITFDMMSKEAEENMNDVLAGCFDRRIEEGDTLYLAKGEATQ